MRTGIRFQPPRVVPSPEISWVMARAFGPPETPVDSSTLVPARALDLCWRLGLLPRVGARNPPNLLEREVGAKATSSLRQAYQATRLKVECLTRLCAEVAGSAAELDLPVILLKGMALHCSRLTQPGSRGMVDADILAPAASAQALQDLLVSRGYRAYKENSAAHQLPPLLHPHGMALELHVSIHSVAVGRGSTANDVLAAGLALPVPELPGHCHVPAPELMAAHALAHGLAQHQGVVERYPFTRLLTDIADLGAVVCWEEMLEATYPFILQATTRDEVEAVVELTRQLTSGIPLHEILADQGGASVVLRHTIATLDHDYRLLWSVDAHATRAPQGMRSLWLGGLLARRALTGGPPRGTAGDRRTPHGVSQSEGWPRRLVHALVSLHRYAAARLRLRTRGALRI